MSRVPSGYHLFPYSFLRAWCSARFGTSTSRKQLGLNAKLFHSQVKWSQPLQLQTQQRVISREAEEIHTCNSSQINLLGSWGKRGWGEIEIFAFL